MKAIALFARTTIVGGVFFLAPIVVLIVVLAKAFGFAKTGLQAVVAHIPGGSDLSVGVATALSIATIALVCSLAGLIARSCPRHASSNAFTTSVLSKFRLTTELQLESQAPWASPRLGSFPLCVRADGRGMAARGSNRSIEQRPRFDLRPRCAEPALRVGLFLFDG